MMSEPLTDAELTDVRRLFPSAWWTRTVLTAEEQAVALAEIRRLQAQLWADEQPMIWPGPPAP